MLRRDERDELALVGDVHRVDPEDLGAPATAGWTGTAASRTTIATPEARASSLSTEATPPRVASRRQRSPGPAASSRRVDRGPQRARVGLDLGVEAELAAGEHDRRAVLTDRARQQDPVARRSRVGRQPARGSRRPRPVVQMYIPSAWPRSTTFVSPATICTPASRAAARDRVDLGAEGLRREALLEHQRERQRERTGAGHREVVDGAVDGELADRAAGEAQRLDDERVGRQRQLERRRR